MKRQKRPLFPWFPAVLLVLTGSCGSQGSKQPGQAVYAEAARSAGPQPTPVDAQPAVAQPLGSVKAPAPGDQAPALAPRLVHHNGYLRLRSRLPENAVRDATRICEEVNGYVENHAGLTVVLRVPVAEFEGTFKRLLNLGDVLARSTTSQDVTEAFTSVTLRLKTLRASRARLQELLGMAKTEKEKLALLSEIKRLTEQVDQFQNQLDTLQSLASFSRVALTVVPHQPHMVRRHEPVAAFRWIHQLSPFRRDVAQGSDYLELTAPEGMVALDDPDHWRAESADGAVMWTSELLNDPGGDAEFWLEAIRFRLEPQYTNAELTEVGGFKMLRLIDAEGYRYLVAMRVDGDVLNMVEVYLPSETHELRYLESIEAALKRGMV